ncbi:pentatricopeptide repeat-containing protein At5g66520-like [Macadamia integrifolia]|uniref:pentatricopeptide repeat-containing protein At5g66520-like n=1 Tax=Macadamia integrifolia TaxID=60698 RepID=UPI001C4F9F24|nr:pentatricopeptide repeat-containing protein At5g66520-like [Macadamia integrifolia]
MFLAEVNLTNLNYRAKQQYLFSLLQCCKRSKELTQIHSQIVVNGFSQKNYILAKLLSFCVTSGNLLHAQQAFDQIMNPSTIVWNQMIRGYALSETPQKSFQFYNQMGAAETKPDGFTFLFLLNACTGPSYLKEGEQLHGRIMSNGLCSNVFVQTNLVNMYITAGGVAGVLKARKVFDEMTQRNVMTWNSMLSGYFRRGDVKTAQEFFYDMPERNAVSWTTMIAGYTKTGKCKQALALFYEMRKAQVEVDQVVLLAALSACAELVDLKTGRWIHSYLDKASCIQKPDFVPLKNALIHMYASCGVIEEAYRMFKEMSHRSTISWTTMIIGFAKQGFGEEALVVFRWMQSVEGEGIRPDEITFIGVLCACSHRGWVDEGRTYFKCMTTTYNLEPRIEHYGCMVDLLSRAGQLDEAQKLIETMPMKPNTAIWGALLGGCRIYKNVELAANIDNQLALVFEPDQAAGFLVLLLNVYATAKRWDDVAMVRRRMVAMGLRKPSGRSWIQVDGVIHEFVAGDQSHRHATAINKMVEEITRLAKLEGHVLCTSDVLLDEEEKGRASIN